MGIFSKIAKGLKNVFGGIMKVFSPILEPVTKFLSSDIGKAIMAGLSIFTLGTAMIAGGQAFGAGLAGSVGNASGGFINAFVQGGKQFMSTLMTGEGFQGAAPATQTEAVTQAAQVAAEGVGTALETGSATSGLVEGAGAGVDAVGGAVPGLGGSGSGTFNPALEGGNQLGMDAMKSGSQGLLTQGQNMGLTDSNLADKMLAGGGEAGQTAQSMSRMAAEGNFGAEAAAAADKGWLSKAKESAMKFAKSEGGSNIIGKLIEGAGNYYTSKDQQEFDDRIRRQWGKGDSDPGIRSMRESNSRIGQFPTGQVSDVSGLNRASGGRPQFRRPVGQGAGG